MMSMNLRIRLVQALIEINETLFFYHRLRRVYRKLVSTRGLKVIDVGANKGQSINFFRSLDPGSVIWAFEPNMGLFILLSKKYGTDPDIHLFQKGVSDHGEGRVFLQNILDETSSFESPELGSVYMNTKAKILGVESERIIVDSYPVETITLATFLSNHPDVVFDVLKIDVEGHEFNCVKGMTAMADACIPVKFIQLERQKTDMYKNIKADEIDELLKDMGFVLTSEIRHGFAKYYERIYKNTRLS